MTAVCPACYREQGAGLLCSSCCSLLEYELSEVPAIVDELDVTLSRQGRIGAGGHGGLASEKTPIHPGAMDPVWVLGNVLTTWARDVAGDPATWPDETEVVVYRNPDATIIGPFCAACYHPTCRAMRMVKRPARPAAIVAAHILLSEMTTIRKHPAADEIMDEVCDAIRLARRTIDRPADRQFLGPCNGMFEGVRCTADVYASPGASHARCKVCGSTIDVGERRAWLLEQAADMLVTSREAARLVGTVGHIAVGESRIRNYLHRGKIGLRSSADKVKRFRLGDLLTILVEESGDPQSPQVDVAS